MRFADDCELLANLIKLDIVLSAFGEEGVDLIVIGLNSGDKGRLGVAVPGFFVPIERFAAICGKLFLAHCERFADKMLLGCFLKLEELPIDMRHIALKRTACALDLIGICGVCVAGGYIEVDDRSVGCLEDELAIVLGVAEGVATVHMAEYLRHSVVIIQKVECLVKRMRSGVCKVAAVEVKTALPVPTSCKIVELDTDVNDSSQFARSDDLFYLFEIVSKAALLENEKLKSLAFGNGNENIVFFNGGNKGLFAKNVKAVLQKVLRYCKVEIAGKRVNDKVDIVAVQNFLIIGINVAAVFLCGSFAADVHLIDYRNDLEAFGVLFKMQAVNIAAASTLTEYSNAYLFHNLMLLFGRFFLYDLIVANYSRKVKKNIVNFNRFFAKECLPICISRFREEKIQALRRALRKARDLFFSIHPFPRFRTAFRTRPFSA